MSKTKRDIQCSKYYWDFNICGQKVYLNIAPAIRAYSKTLDIDCTNDRKGVLTINCCDWGNGSGELTSIKRDFKSALFELYKDPDYTDAKELRSVIGQLEDIKWEFQKLLKRRIKKENE